MKHLKPYNESLKELPKDFEDDIKEMCYDLIDFRGFSVDVMYDGVITDGHEHLWVAIKKILPEYPTEITAAHTKFKIDDEIEEIVTRIVEYVGNRFKDIWYFDYNNNGWIGNNGYPLLPKNKNITKISIRVIYR